MTENISSTNLPQNPDASDLAMCTRHKNRMHFQTEFIPKLVANINDGYLPPVALYMSSEWNLGDDFNMGEGFSFNTGHTAGQRYLGQIDTCSKGTGSNGRDIFLYNNLFNVAAERPPRTIASPR